MFHMHICDDVDIVHRCTDAVYCTLSSVSLHVSSFFVYMYVYRDEIRVIEPSADTDRQEDEEEQGGR